MTTAFMIAVAKVISKEGRFSNDPKDPGNWTGGKIGVGVLKGTKYGISAARFPDEDIENLTMDRARHLHHLHFWQPLKLDSIDSKAASLAGEMFDTAVNCAPHIAVKILQGTLTILKRPVTIDGIMGPKTLAAANSYAAFDIEALLKWMNVLQGCVYLFGAGQVEPVMDMIRPRLGHLQHHARGWAKRLEI